MDELSRQIIAIIIVSLRFAPALAFAPPFTLIRVPLLIRVLLGISLSMWLVMLNPELTYQRDVFDEGLFSVVLGELIIGITTMLTLQWAFAAILTAGRAIDIQAGYGLALLIDPATRAQMPLNGTVFAYAAAAVFFAIGGPFEMLGIWVGSLETLPLGASYLEPNMPVLLGYISTVFLLAIGLAGIVFMTLFMLDMTVAFLSRTLPQMNVLLIGFQVKTLAVLMTVPLAIGYSSALFLRLVRLALDTAPLLLGS